MVSWQNSIFTRFTNGRYCYARLRISIRQTMQVFPEVHCCGGDDVSLGQRPPRDRRAPHPRVLSIPMYPQTCKRLAYRHDRQGVDVHMAWLRCYPEHCLCDVIGL